MRSHRRPEGISSPSVSDPDPDHRNPLPPRLPPGDNPPSSPPRDPSPSVFSLLACLVPGVAAAYGTHQGLLQFSIPGNDFAIMTGPGYFFFGMVGGAVLGVGLSWIAISRGESLSKTPMFLMPAILGNLVVLAAGLWLSRNL
jgi:hypothetical protein